MTKRVAVDERSAEIIEREVRSGHFESEAHVVRHALELLAEEARFIDANADALRSALADPDSDRDYLPAEEVFAEMRARYQRSAIRRK